MSFLRGMKRLAAGALVFTGHLAVASERDDPKAAYRRPTTIPFPAHAPYAPQMATLGKMLFFDPRLSGKQNLSCASCHNPSFGFEVPVPGAIGATNTPLGRKAPTVLNAAWIPTLFWDGRAPDLETQAMGPITADAEMDGKFPEIIARLKARPEYEAWFARLFPGKGVTQEGILTAIATYERTVVSGWAPFDRWVEGDETAIPPAAQRGFALFTGKAGCAACHTGWNFTDNRFHDLGLPTRDLGRAAFDPDSVLARHAFKTPGLRNLTYRAPFGHAGQFADLEAILAFYETGGLARPSKSPLMKPLQLAPEERADLIAFLRSLTASGVKSWAIRYRYGGKTRKFTIGPYPLFELGEAREQARKALQMVALGRDPFQAKKSANEAAEAAVADRVEAVVTLYVNRHLKPNGKPGYAEVMEALLLNHVVPRWGKRRIGEITRKDVIALTDSLTDAGMTTGANRVFAAARAMFNFALGRELIATTPFLGLKPPLSETSRDRVLTDAEIRLVWLAADKIGFPFGSAVQMLLLTGQRRDEVIRMVRSEIEADVWTIPAARTKNSLEHVVPLPSAAVKILDGLPHIAGTAGYVFTRTGTSPISDYSDGKRRIDAAMLSIAKDEAWKAGKEPDTLAFIPWRLHDLRRTCSSGIARLGYPVHVGEAVLNHRSGAISGLAAVYNRYQYLAEKRAALEAWSSHVNALMGQNDER